ncbi:MAG: DNA mismatch repair protein MutS, partial [Flavobacteriales bacterium]
MRNLELVSPVNEGGRTLLQALDRCTTPMGSRLLRRWLLFPLLDVQEIAQRQDVVQALIGESGPAELLTEQLGHIGDLERLAGKAAAGRINPRELLQLHHALEAASRISTG